MGLKEILRIPVAASMLWGAACDTADPGEPQEAECRENDARLVEGACLSNEYPELEALRQKCGQLIEQAVLRGSQGKFIRRWRCTRENPLYFIR